MIRIPFKPPPGVVIIFYNRSPNANVKICTIFILQVLHKSNKPPQSPTGLMLEAKNIAFLQVKKIASLHDTIALIVEHHGSKYHGSFPKHHHHKENSVTWNMRRSAKESVLKLETKKDKKSSQ